MLDSVWYQLTSKKKKKIELKGEIQSSYVVACLSSFLFSFLTPFFLYGTFHVFIKISGK